MQWENSVLQKSTRLLFWYIKLYMEVHLSTLAPSSKSLICLVNEHLVLLDQIILWCTIQAVNCRRFSFPVAAVAAVIPRHYYVTLSNRNSVLAT